jgi:hypothetical protein
MDIEVRYDATSIGSLFLPAIYEQYLARQDELKTNWTVNISQAQPSLSTTVLLPWDETTVGASTGSAPPTPQTAAVEALRSYVGWYRAFVDAYVSDLGALAGRKPRRVRFGRELGPERLIRLVDCLAVADHAQAQVVYGVLEGFEDLADATTDLAGRGVLIVRLVEDVVRRLGELHLLREPAIVPTAHANIAIDTADLPHLDQQAA